MKSEQHRLRYDVQSSLVWVNPPDPGQHAILSFWNENPQTKYQPTVLLCSAVMSEVLATPSSVQTQNPAEAPVLTQPNKHFSKAYHHGDIFSTEGHLLCCPTAVHLCSSKQPQHQTGAKVGLPFEELMRSKAVVGGPRRAPRTHSWTQHIQVDSSRSSG